MWTDPLSRSWPRREIRLLPIVHLGTIAEASGHARGCSSSGWRVLVGVLVVLAALSSGGAQARDERLDIQGMTFVSGRGSANEFVVWAEVARVHRETQTADLEQIHLTVTAGERRLGVELRCRRGRLELDSNDFRLEGEVSGQTSDGRRFEVDWVGYDDSEGVLYSDAPVVIRDAGGVYRGGGFRFDIRERRFRLLAGTRVVRER